MSTTKDKILDAAESIFAENGFAAASLRAIIGQAEVNLAAVHYHFGSKEKLLLEVLRRRVGPVNEERLRLLDRCERAAEGGVPELEKVLEAFLAPTLEVARQPNGLVFIRLMGKLHVDDLLPGIVRREFGELLARFGGALRRALPELPEEELQWRSYLAMGAVAQAMRLAVAAPEGTAEAALERLIAFLSAGFRVPLPQPAGKEED